VIFILRAPANNRINVFAGRVPMFWKRVASFVSKVSGSKHHMEYVYKSFERTAFELEQMGFDAVEDYIRTHVKSDALHREPIRRSLVDIVEFHEEHPHYDRSFFMTTFVQLWSDYFAEHWPNE
jgi:hypothetical protein